MQSHGSDEGVIEGLGSVFGAFGVFGFAIRFLRRSGGFVCYNVTLYQPRVSVEDDDVFRGNARTDVGGGPGDDVRPNNFCERECELVSA